MKIITIDGIDGSGKATQTEMLYERLKTLYGDKVFKISFPDYGSTGCKLVEEFLHGGFGNVNTINPFASGLFYSIDRWDFFRRNTFPEDSIIISDRYVLSNIIHQMTKLSEEKWGQFASWIRFTEHTLLEIPEPDIEIYLYLKPEFANELISKRYNGDESKRDLNENLENLKKSSSIIDKYIAGDYLANYILEGLTVIDCNGEDTILDKTDIADKIFNIVIEKL